MVSNLKYIRVKIAYNHSISALFGLQGKFALASSQNVWTIYNKREAAAADVSGTQLPRNTLDGDQLWNICVLDYETTRME